MRGWSDREEWPTLESRVVAATERILDVLDEAESGRRSSSWAGSRSAIRLWSARSRRCGHEIACHGYGHRMIHALTPRRSSREDVTRAKSALEDAAGHAVIGYRAPTFSVMRETLWSLEVLREAGFRYDSSIFPIVHDRYGIPDAPRFPHRLMALGTGRRARRVPAVDRDAGSGGGCRWRAAATFGFFRMRSPARAPAVLNRAEGQPAMVYLHPWELDPDQPRLPVGALTRFRHS